MSLCMTKKITTCNEHLEGIYLFNYFNLNFAVCVTDILTHSWPHFKIVPSETNQEESFIIRYCSVLKGYIS